MAAVYSCRPSLMLDDAAASAANRAGRSGRARRRSRVAKVTREDLYKLDEMTAEFRPYVEVELHAKVSGYLKDINVDFGDKDQGGAAFGHAGNSGIEGRTETPSPLNSGPKRITQTPI